MNLIVKFLTFAIHHKKLLILVILLFVIAEVIWANGRISPVDSIIRQDIKDASLVAGNDLPVTKDGVVKGYGNISEQNKLQTVLNNALFNGLKNLKSYPVGNFSVKSDITLDGPSIMEEHVTVDYKVTGIWRALTLISDSTVEVTGTVDNSLK